MGEEFYERDYAEDTIQENAIIVVKRIYNVNEHKCEIERVTRRTSRRAAREELKSRR